MLYYFAFEQATPGAKLRVRLPVIVEAAKGAGIWKHTDRIGATSDSDINVKSEYYRCQRLKRFSFRRLRVCRPPRCSRFTHQACRKEEASGS